MKKIIAILLVGITIILFGCANKEFTLEQSKKNIASLNCESADLPGIHGVISSEGKIITLDVDGKEVNVLGYEFLYEYEGKTIKTYITFNNDDKEYKVGDRIDYDSTYTHEYIVGYAGDNEAITIMYFK